VKIIDFHCDVLYKMLKYPDIDFFRKDDRLDVTYSALRQVGMLMQVFAIYLPESFVPKRFQQTVDVISLFRRKIMANPQIIHVRSSEDLRAVQTERKLGALLSLEGVDGLEGVVPNLEIIYQLGVRAVGITWNYANWAADGIKEPRGGGFSLKGRELVRECNRLGMILDVSHLSVRGFWELVEMTTRPFIASHSNAFSVCAHPRNLRDDQIRAVIRLGGRIGVTFVPQFLSARSGAKLKHVLQHIDHICALGGEHYLGFGSDFDGIDEWTEGLEKAEQYGRLAEELLKHYKEEQVRGFLYQNWYDFLEEQL